MENYVIIIGAMKSGTTTLFDLLAQHPQIAPARPKEPGFFAFDDTYAKGFEWYHSLFDFDPSIQKFRLDGSTDYTKTPYVENVWHRMQARAKARYKLIYIMRHPLRRLESHARHVQMRGKEIGQEISTQGDHSLDQGVSLRSLAMTQYATQLDHFAQAHHSGDLHLVTLEELTQSPQDTLKKIWSFLELDPVDSAGLNSHSNAADNQVAVRQSWTRLTSNHRIVAIVKRLMPQAIRERLKGLFTKKMTAEGRFRWNEKEEATLCELLEADLRNLRDRYNVDTEKLWNLPRS